MEHSYIIMSKTNISVLYQKEIQLIKNALMQNGRNQYEDIRYAVIYQHDYCIFRDIQVEAFRQLLSK